MITEQARRNYEARIAELKTSLDKLTRTLRIAGFADAGGDLWKPPLGPAAPPLLAQIDALKAERDQLIQAVADHVTARAERSADLHAALRLVSDIRFAVGDDGKRMQDELIAHLSELRKDAERYAKLKQRLIAADFDYQGADGNAETVLIFSWPREAPVSANLDAMLDALEIPQ